MSVKNQRKKLHQNYKIGRMLCLNLVCPVRKVLIFYAFFLSGKAKRKIHARYPFLGGDTYQPPMLSVLYLQVGYQPVAAGISRVMYAGPARFPQPRLIIIQGDLPGARTLCLMNTKEGCLAPPGTLRI